MAVLKLLTLANILFLLPSVDGGKILILATSTSRSHINLFVSIINELSVRNHEITVLGYQKFQKLNSRMSVLQLRTPPILEDDAALGKKIMDAAKDRGMLRQLLDLETDIRDACEVLLQEPATKDLIAGGNQFDLVIVDSFCDECALPLAFLLGKHVVRLSGTAWWTWKQTSVPTPLSYVPNYFDRFTSRMSFWQRLTNLVVTVATRIAFKHTVIAAQQGVLDKYLPQAMTVEEAEEKLAFCLTNGDPVLTSPRPSMPDVVHCGPLHCRDAKPLPEELKDFVESSGQDGFIIFALGTNIKSEALSPEFREAVLSTFSRLKQKVIWKFGSKLDSLPGNVKIMDFLPQQDLLGHPKARLFITHSGLLSLQEAIYHGVPVVGLPFFGDQPGNIARMEELGIGEYLNFFNVTADGFYEVVTKVLNDRRYYDNMKKYSSIMKDQPERPIDRAVFWLEYLIRHDGARHFRSAGNDLNFFQYHLLDVIGFALVSFFTILGTIVYLIKWILTLWQNQRRSQAKKKRN